MPTTEPLPPVEPGQQYEADEFRPEDAPGIVQLVRQVYGEGYPIKIFYDPEALAKANEAEQNCSLVARTPKGDIVGVQNLFRSAPYPGLYEVGAGLVLKEYRKLGISTQLLDYAYEQWVPRRTSIEETFGEAVCNHIYMQKLVASMRHVEMALEVALMPAEAYSKEASAGGRVASLLVFRCYRPKPHRIFIPSVYEDRLRGLYAGLDDEREIALSTAGLASDVTSRCDMQIFDFAQVARIAVQDCGADFPAYLSNLENRAVENGVVVFQVWLKLASPSVGAAVEVLRNKGYFFGGPLPRWFAEDGLLMQRVLCDPCFEGIQLYSERAKGLMAFIKEDWARAVQQA